ncbi:hypothetical protein A1O1_03813 [Capronia coronata CBS 617.96]|uniref:N-acetyltransferase domain-containing protein n=1 Tax=Capronia coronata CBS 617.96 TaxID=1182541 RepID=W9Z857_9EURO|nr:uncharacterized protein A1O1_03813 [Capronia coronata CBS 617.96]EXJ90709.1 hypothetical protein A1O1_03813 [Capronia coronata CBS 617.96]
MSQGASTTAQSRTWTWTRDGFLISTDPSLIPIPALNKAFASKEMYWASPLPEQAMGEMLANSLSFGLYSPTPLPPRSRTTDTEAGEEGVFSTSGIVDPAETLHEIATSVRTESSARQNQGPDDRPSSSRSDPDPDPESSLIGFARGVTDRVTFFYLTDVYIQPEWQGQGLGKWLISCVQECVEDSMPYLRRTMCIIGHARDSGVQFYGKLMKMEPLQGEAMVLAWKGPGCSF